ncbi:hypothetical protein GP486_006149 [Trichoglossum hirsutum]|uniref:Uncharacterized protein n=1 Tax=Trichoglossum hirsutum TaxID=265104 RepID=A0A9P8L7W2_9PEZI|nr:hypothetical protein GP486_006149 [Trichoglossum hirsutum]
MGDGLPGHEFDFYAYVRDSTWMGGRQEYSDLHESAPYWFNYIVPLAYGLNDARLKQQVEQFVEYVISHQADDGWIGSERGYEARDLWARFPLMLGLTQLVEADPRYVDSVIPAMHKFLNLMRSMLRDNYRGYTFWGQARSHDMIIVLQWMYENYPGNNTEVLFDNMRLLNEAAYDWSYYFREDVFPMQDLETLPVDDSLGGFEHGVNLGQALKSGAVVRRFTHNDTLLESTRNGVNWTFLYHGSPSGAIIGDERISGLSPMRG